MSASHQIIPTSVENYTAIQTVPDSQFVPTSESVSQSVPHSSSPSVLAFGDLHAEPPFSVSVSVKQSPAPASFAAPSTSPLRLLRASAESSEPPVTYHPRRSGRNNALRAAARHQSAASPSPRLPSVQDADVDMQDTRPPATSSPQESFTCVFIARLTLRPNRNWQAKSSRI